MQVAGLKFSAQLPFGRGRERAGAFRLASRQKSVFSRVTACKKNDMCYFIGKDAGNGAVFIGCGVEANIPYKTTA